MDRIPIPPIKKDTVQKTKPTTTLPPLRATQQSSTNSEISGRQVPIMQESPVVLPSLIQPKSGMILGSQPLFASEHDDKVGSIYFEKGRLRLIHPSGPTREVYRSYCLCMTNPDKKARNRDIDTIRIWVKKYWDMKIYPSIEAFEKKFLGSIRMIKVDKHAVNESIEGSLFELIVDSNGGIRSYHPSRGYVSPLKKTLTQEQLDFLELSVIYSKQISHWIMSKININGTINITADSLKTLLREDLLSLKVKRENVVMIWKIFSLLIEIYSKQDNIDEAISHIIQELKIYVEIDRFSNDLRHYIFDKKFNLIGTQTRSSMGSEIMSKEQLIKKYNTSPIYLRSIYAFIKYPHQDPSTIAYYTVLKIYMRNNHFLERLRGYFGNQLLRESGALDGTGLDVDDDN